MDKTAIICKLHEVIDHYMFGPGDWPANRECLTAFSKMVRDLDFEEDVPDRPGMTRSTALGKELKLELLMAFVGAWDLWEIPFILEEYGYIDGSQAKELWTGPRVEMERKLRGYVFQAYLQFCNHSHRRH